MSSIVQVTEEEVIRALSTVHDPDLKRDLVSLKMIEDVKVDGTDVSFTVVLTTPACPMKGLIESNCKKAVSALGNVSNITINMTSRVVSTRSPVNKESLPGVRNLIAVGSGKGGVGKTTVSVNVALALADAGAKVGVLDADITGPNVPLMLGVGGQPTGSNGKITPLMAYGVKVISIAFFVPEGQPIIWRGPMVGGAIQQFLRDVDWGDLDYLIVDLPPGTGDAALSLAQAIPLGGVVIVTTPQDVAVMDASKSLAMFQKLEAPIIGFVENMSQFICPHCGERTDIFSYGGGERAAAESTMDFLGRIPLNPQIVFGGDHGIPVLKSHPDSIESQAFREVASAIAARVSVLAVGSASKRPTWIPLKPVG